MINSLQLYKKNLLLAQNIPTMNLGICALSLLPLRAEPSSKSEMVSQLLFGEAYRILEEKEDWYFIETLDETYQGWINNLQVEALTAPLDRHLVQTVFPFVMAKNLSNQQMILLPVGAKLNGYFIKEEQLGFMQNGVEYLVQTETFNTNCLNLASGLLLAKQFLNSPYLWGGKSAFGIDCSGFTQIIFACMNKQLPRDAYQQAEQGEALTFIEEIVPGDLLFFGANSDKITHVGIALGQGEIIHAAGKVRIDKVDSYGIFNRDLQKHTHILRTIRRIL